MDWKLPARGPRPHHPTERRTLSPRYPRVHLLSPRGPRPRLVEQRHAQWTSDRANPGPRCQSDCAPTPRRALPPVHVATSCIERRDAGVLPRVRVASGVDCCALSQCAFSRCPTARRAATTISKLISSVSCSTLCLGTASGLLRCPASAELLLCLCPRSGSGSPVPVPPEKQLLVLGAAPTRFQVPDTTGRTRRNVCTSIESP